MRKRVTLASASAALVGGLAFTGAGAAQADVTAAPQSTVPGAGLGGVADTAHAPRNTPQLSSICKAHYIGRNGAYSKCSPPRAQWTHRIVLVCLTPANVQYKKYGPWVGGYSTSKKYCNHQWDDLNRAYVQEYSEPPA